MKGCCMHKRINMFFPLSIHAPYVHAMMVHLVLLKRHAHGAGLRTTATERIAKTLKAFCEIQMFR